jgi:hypothetical protein
METHGQEGTEMGVDRSQGRSTMAAASPMGSLGARMSPSECAQQAILATPLCPLAVATLECTFGPGSNLWLRWSLRGLGADGGLLTRLPAAGSKLSLEGARG